MLLENLIQYKEPLTEQQKLALVEDLGIVTKARRMFYALRSVLVVMPHLEKLLQQINNDQIQKTVEVLNDLIQNKDELKHLLNSMPEIQQITKEMGRFFGSPEKAEEPEKKQSFVGRFWNAS